MIVICQRCDTRFQLDDARVPETGARVRCSRCKHSFLVMPPGASEDETVHALAADAALRAAPTPPRVTEDLVQPKPAASASADEENEWQFAEQQRPAPTPTRAGKADPEAEQWRGVFEEEKPPEALELDELGSPESWSFVSEEAPPARPPRSGAPEAVAAPRSETKGVPIGRVKLVRPGTPLETAPEPLQSVPAPPPRTLERVGWALTALLLLAIVYGIDWDGPASGAVSQTFPLRDGLIVENLSLRRFDNLVSGPVLVVGGAVANPGPDPAGGPSHLRARLVAGDHAAEAEAGPPRGLEQLREAPIEAMEGITLLASPLAPGARIPFEAVIPRPPAGAARLELRLEPASPSEARPTEAPPVTGDPSPRTLLPSSG